MYCKIQSLGARVRSGKQFYSFEKGAGYGKKMLIHLIKSTCDQIDREEYKEHEKESVIYILYVSQYGMNCKRRL